MNEILQQRIEEAADEYIETAIDSGENNFVDEGGMPLFDDDYVKATYIEAATIALQNQWISVEEALPKDNKVVFYRALSEKGTKCYGSAYVFKKEWYSDIDSAAQDYFHYKITHWMSIPTLEGGEE